jgi:hypothetical protein
MPEHTGPTSVRRAHRLARLLVAALVLPGVTSACGSVPSTGPVVEGLPAGEAAPPPYVGVQAEGPRPGDSPQQVVEGFFTAMVSYEDGYATARQFLSPSAAQNWDPTAMISVVEASTQERRTSVAGSRVRLVLPLLAEVDAGGALRAAREGAALTLTLRTVRIDDEWRIDTPPDGVVMSDFDFRREFAPLTTYYFHPEAEVLVPEPAFLPVRGGLPTLLVRRQLAGAGAWLAAAVRTAVPEGTTLATDTVEVRGATAVVDLSSQAAGVSREERQRLAGQLAWTLRQVPGVTSVQLEVEGEPLPLADYPEGVVPISAFQYLDATRVPAGDQLVTVQDGVVAQVRTGLTGDPEPVPGPLGGDIASRSVGMDLSGRQAAAVTEDGQLVVRAPLLSEADADVVVNGRDVAPPSWDRTGAVWVVDQASPVPDVTRVTDNDARAVPARGLRGMRVQELRISPDGVRVAVLGTRASGRPRVLIGLVQGTGVGVRLAAFRALPVPQGTVLDLAWSSPTSLAVLSRRPGTAAQVSTLDLADESVTLRGEVDDGVEVAAGPGRPLVVGTSEGELLVQDPVVEWRRLGAGRAPAYPG